jgi:hypothetical protein
MRVIALDSLQQFTAVNLLSTDLGSIPGPVVIPQCAQITLRWNLADGKIGHNVLYGRYSGGFAGTVSQANAIMTALTSGAPWTALNALLTTGGAFAGVDIRNVAVADQPILPSTNAAVPGTDAGGALPNEVAAVITLRTAKAGRANRGRMYIPNFSLATMSPGNIMSAAALTALQNWANTIIGALSPSGYALVIGQRARAAYTSPITGRVFPARAANSELVTSLSVRDNHWDSQRKRGLR